MSEPPLPPAPPSTAPLPPPPVPVPTAVEPIAPASASAGWGSAAGGARVCPRCGLPLDGYATVCPRCGLPQGPTSPGSGKDRLVAALLALLLGGFGIHKFYLDRIGLGLLYLVFFWTGIPGFIAWIEAMIYLARSDEKWALEYGGPVQRANRAGLGCLWAVALLPLLSIVAIIGLIFLGSQVSQTLVTDPPIETPAALFEQPTPASSLSADQVRIDELTLAIDADPNDTTSMLELADLYYVAEDFTKSASWLERVLAIEPSNVQAKLALGACRFNLGDNDAAKRQWLDVIAADPANTEAYYDLGFLALNEPVPDYATVERMWRKVIELDPGSELATTVREHLDTLAAESLLP